jgi:hypothetical protein
MKTIFLAMALSIAATVAVSAQQTTPVTHDIDSITKDTNRVSGRLLTFRDLDQRRVYNWKNGQRSTPSGREAEAGKAKYIRVWGDSAMVVRDPKKDYQ